MHPANLTIGSLQHAISRVAFNDKLATCVRCILESLRNGKHEVAVECVETLHCLRKSESRESADTVASSVSYEARLVELRDVVANVVRQLFAAATQKRDVQQVLNYGKLFPRLQLAKEGLKKISDFVSQRSFGSEAFSNLLDKLDEQANKNGEIILLNFLGSYSDLQFENDQQDRKRVVRGTYEHLRVYAAVQALNLRKTVKIVLDLRLNNVIDDKSFVDDVFFVFDEALSRAWNSGYRRHSLSADFRENNYLCESYNKRISLHVINSILSSFIELLASSIEVLDIIFRRLRFSQLGGLQLEREIRRFILHLSSTFPEVAVREKCARLLHISSVLSVESPVEVSEYWEGLVGAPKLSILEMKRILHLRVDFKIEQVDSFILK
eukprot:31479-Pelagococcus_subviridis.AAC.16